MFILITAEQEIISTDTEVQVFETHEQAHEAMVYDAEIRVLDAGIDMADFDEYVDHIGDDGGYIMDVVVWQIREIEPPKVDGPRMNPTKATTVEYTCKEGRYSNSLLHTADVQWESGMDFPEHAPERIELRVGGKAYEYKAV